MKVFRKRAVVRNKLESKYEGPFTIEEVLDRNRVVIGNEFIRSVENIKNVVPQKGVWEETRV